MSWVASLFLAGTMFSSGSVLSALEHGIERPVRLDDRSPVLLDETERFLQTYPFDRDGKVEVSNLNGSITVSAWNKEQIELEAVKTADTKDRLADVKIVVDASQSSFFVRTEYKKQKDRKRKYSKLKVDLHLKVPGSAYLKGIQSVNGSVKVADMTNYTRVSAVNGSVTATDLQGTAKLSTVNGSVTAGFARMGADSVISLSTVSGSASLSLPSDINATIRANTLNGSIENDFGLPVKKRKYVGRDLYGRIGSGDVKIKLNSVNGGLSIKRNNDGGTPNPTVNLLPQKTSDEFDESFEKVFEVEVSKLTDDFEKALAESAVKIELSQESIETALKVAEAAMANITPEIAAISAEKLKLATAAIDEEQLRKSLDLEKARIAEELARVSETLYFGRSPFVEEKSETIDVTGTPTVTIDAKNANVTVRGWNESKVRYSVTRIKRNTAPGMLEVSASKEGSEITIKVKNTSGSALNEEQLLEKVRLEVYVPKRSNLTISSKRAIRLEGVTGDLELIGSKGPINVRDSGGELRIGSTAGTVRVIGFEGLLLTQTARSELYLEGSFSEIRSKAERGKVHLTLPDGTDARISAPSIATEDGRDVSGDDLTIGNIDLKREDADTWRAGNGKATYTFEIGEGTLMLRPQSAVLPEQPR